MLNIENLYLTFNKGTVNEKPALCGASVSLSEGDFVTIIGGNGAGKSTLLNAVAGVYRAYSGRVELDGTDISPLPDYKRAAYISRVFQDPLLGTAARMNIEENLALAMRRGKRRGLSWGITEKERVYYKERLAELDLGLENRMGQKAGTLSGGQRQALTLLMASLASPKVLLLDEHTAALDPKTAAKVLDLTNKVATSELITMMVTHNMNDAIKYGNKLIMMDSGRVVFEVSGEEKKKLTIPFLLQKFESAVGEQFANDKMLLG